SGSFLAPYLVLPRWVGIYDIVFLCFHMHCFPTLIDTFSITMAKVSKGKREAMNVAGFGFEGRYLA
ncbi:hypothetical protein, partial [Sphingobacterium sp. JB170]|uniref:hypothetical protein n=1 Tax=Sphingobacterium sp. JB170 TaxID=1434842 RepID=UPI001C4FC8C9